MTKAIEDEDYTDYYKLQTEFHDIYTCKCGNEELISTIHRLKKYFIKQSYQKERSGIKDLLHSAIKEHKVILRLFREHKTTELDQYLKDVHWNVEYAQLDSI
jgi:DNA-binding GntR family transcriptional regulator